ncbi:MAG: hypothetical protein M3Y75_10300 [Actinomycetota bacterium]|nr:hypothetical protein [Actinomycetota bacterium]
MVTDSLVKAGGHARNCVGETFASKGNPGVISFTVWCGIQTGEVRFTLRQAKEGRIVNFSRRLGVSGRGAAAPFHCYRRSEVVRCAGRKQGPVTIRGWIAVDEGSRCSRTTILATERLLHMGKPVGCPGVRPPQPPRDMGHMRRFRREFGLDLDLDGNRAAINQRIQALISAWKRGEPVARYTNASWGLPLRARDERELEYRHKYLEQFNEELYPWVRLHAQTTYAGYDMDHAHGGIIYVGFVGDQDAQLATFMSSLNSIAPGRIKPFPVPPKYSMAHLVELQVEIATQPVKSEGPGWGQFINRVGINVLGNVVEVGTDHLDEVRRLIAEKYGPDAPISVVFSPPVRDMSAEVSTSAGAPSFCQGSTAGAALAARAGAEAAPQGLPAV